MMFARAALEALKRLETGYILTVSNEKQFLIFALKGLCQKKLMINRKLTASLVAEDK